MPSLVAEIGDVINSHLVMIGLVKEEELDEHRQKLIDEKRAEYDKTIRMKDKEHDSEFPESAQLCAKCHTKAVILMDGCMTCLNCGDSKCG